MTVFNRNRSQIYVDFVGKRMPDRAPSKHTFAPILANAHIGIVHFFIHTISLNLNSFRIDFHFSTAAAIAMLLGSITSKWNILNSAVLIVTKAFLKLQI